MPSTPISRGGKGVKTNFQTLVRCGPPSMGFGRDLMDCDIALDNPLTCQITAVSLRMA